MGSICSDMPRSNGILRYQTFLSQGTTKYKLSLEIDQGIADFYRSLIPKSITTNRPRYDAHVSIVRKEMPANFEVWGKYEGQDVEFYYDTRIYHGRNYYWLNVFCKRLEDIREELGLPRTSEITKPPTGWDWCFHTTIANTKNLESD